LKTYAQQINLKFLCIYVIHMLKIKPSSRMMTYFQDELFSLCERGLVEESHTKYRLTDFAAKTLAASLETYLTEPKEDFKEGQTLNTTIIICGLHDRRMPSNKSDGLSFEQIVGTVLTIGYLVDGCNTPEEMAAHYIRENQGHTTDEWYWHQFSQLLP
jgi:hypothetical protein